MSKQKILFLLDAYALIYRAYFAFIKNPRINSKGVNTSAIFGFTNSLIEIINKETPSHIAVVFDTRKPTTRHIAFPDYKAHREAMPEGISEALPFIDQLLQALKISKLYVDGYEADDVIGTLAKKAEKKGFKVYMMTPDKDFAQLVSKNIFMYRPANKWQPKTILGISEVLEKFKIKTVDQVIDMLGMMGDSADNIPGIPGIGEKTAQKFIAKYGSMEELFNNVDLLKGKLKEKVKSGKEIGLLSKKLVTIITDVPIEFHEEDLRIKSKDESLVATLFKELEFYNLQKRMFSKEPQNELQKTDLKKTENVEGIQMNLFSNIITKDENIKEVTGDYRIIRESEAAKKYITELKPHHKIVVELCVTSNDFSDAKIIGVSFCDIDAGSCFIILPEKELLYLLKTIFENPKFLLIGYGLKTQMKILVHNNIKISAQLFDIRIAHYLIFPEMRQNINLLFEKYLKESIGPVEVLTNKIKNKTEPHTINNKLAFSYNKRAEANLKLYHILIKELKNIELEKLAETVEMPLIKVLTNMEINGIKVDKDLLSKYENIFSNDLNILTKEIQIISGVDFNVASPKQLGEVLFEKMKIISNPKKTKSGQYSTSEETLKKINGKHSIIQRVLDYRELKKLLSTYILALPELINPYTQKIHTTFNQTVTSTGRLSSISPNLQNIPIKTEKGRKIRKAFISKNKNYSLLSADYSQIELRIVASLSNDANMLTAFDQGKDIHLATAAKVYNLPLDKVTQTMRSHAKSINFGIIYGISAFGLSQNTDISRSAAKAIIEEYFLQFPGVKKYIDASIEQARKNEFVETIFGRRRYLKDINSRNATLRGMAERNAINTPIQGSASDIIKKAMIKIDAEIKKRKLKSRMLLQVHDELIFDMHQNEKEMLKKLVKNNMETAIKLKIPLMVDIGEGKNWLEAH